MAHDRPKATIYDVAGKAGVAISTVSRVLNGSADVSDRTRARVLKAIENLQFRPDRTAKTLAQKHHRAVAIAIPTFTTPFHNELLKGVRTRLRDLDHDLLLCDLGSESPTRSLLRFLKRGTVDGILLAGLPIDSAIAEELQALQAPVVLVGPKWDAFDSFYWDDVAGSRQAVEHLISQGHRRIAMIVAHTSSMLRDFRVAGYRDALDGAGIPFDESLIVTGVNQKHGGYSEEAGYEAMDKLFQFEDPVTAVYASSDVQAIGAWKAIRDIGKRVPEDFALVGYDDIKTSRYIGLSSVDQSVQDVGLRATELLLERLADGKLDDPVSVMITPKLNVRESSRWPRGEGSRPA
jgi:LacI family transcriptional regulator